MIDKLLTIKEIAKILRVSDWLVNYNIGSSQLQASRIGQWRIRQKDLEKFLEENSNDKRNQRKIIKR